MTYSFIAVMTIEGQQVTHKMTYSSVDIIKTLERRIKTAFPNATHIGIVLDNQEPTNNTSPEKKTK